MKDLEVSDFEGGLVGVGDAAADDGSLGSAAAAAADFDPQLISSLLASDPRLETENMEDIEEVLGSRMSNFPMLRLGMELTDDESDDLDPTLNSSKKKKQKQQRGGRKRLSVYQVYSLEKSFKIDSKLVPQRKQQLAKELGLRPRQVAIWFQNRRARHKNKQIEKDYDKIAGQYGVIKAEFDMVVSENKKLKVEMKKMKQEMNLMKDNLMKYRKLMRAGRLMGSQMMKTQIQTPLLQNCSHSSRMEFEAASNGGVIGLAPQVQPHLHQQANSPASVTSVFDSNSPVFTSQQLLHPADMSRPVAEPEPDEKTESLMQQGEQEMSVNNLSNLLDLDGRNFFYSFPAGGPPANPYSFGAVPADDEAFWQFEL